MSSTKSLKDSSTTTSVPCSSAAFKINSIDSCPIRLPTGLFGLQRNSKSPWAMVFIMVSAFHANLSSARKNTGITWASTLAAASSYSLKVGTGIITFRGLIARTKRYINSAAPFPDITQRGSKPKYPAAARLKVTASGSG